MGPFICHIISVVKCRVSRHVCDVIPFRLNVILSTLLMMMKIAVFYSLRFDANMLNMSLGGFKTRCPLFTKLSNAISFFNDMSVS